MQIALDATRASHGPAATLPAGARLLHAAPGPQPNAARSFEKGAAVFAEGDPATAFYKVVAGAVRTSQLLSDGRRQIDSFHLPGDIFGIESGARHVFSADVVEDATLIAYRGRCLDALAGADADLARQIAAAMIRSLERARAHMLLLGRKTALERIATFLLDLSARLPDMDHIDLPMSRMDIADHLGLTIETVSRLLTRLDRDGVIEVSAQRRSIILRDRAALRRLGT